MARMFAGLKVWAWADLKVRADLEVWVDLKVGAYKNGPTTNVRAVGPCETLA